MAATERLLLSVFALVMACDEGGLSVGVPDAPDDAGAPWDSDDGPPPGLEEGGGSEDPGPGPGTDEPASLLVAAGSSWRYETGPTASPAWTEPGFDDSAWASDPAPFGLGFDNLGTLLPPGPARLRTTFELDDPAVVDGLLLRLRRDDGVITWLNGVEVFRSNMAATGDDPGQLAMSEVIAYDAYFYYRAFPDAALLQAGTNTLAVSVHPHAGNDGDLVFDAVLQTLDPLAVPDRLSFRARTLGYGGKYGPRNVGALWIEDANGFVKTLEVWGDVRREHLVSWRASSNDNDVDALTASTRSVHGTHLAEWDLTRADGSPAEPGLYRVIAEYTEANSNSSAAPGPRIELQVELGAGPTVLSTAQLGDTDRFAELLLYAP